MTDRERFEKWRDEGLVPREVIKINQFLKGLDQTPLDEFTLKIYQRGLQIGANTTHDLLMPLLESLIRDVEDCTEYNWKNDGPSGCDTHCINHPCGPCMTDCFSERQFLRKILTSVRGKLEKLGGG